MKQFSIPCRITLRGEAFVEAKDHQTAINKFERGRFEFDHSPAEMVNWERMGEPEPIE